MKVEYPHVSQDVQGDAENPHMLLADKGTYIFLGTEKNTSVYNGVGFFHGEDLSMTKVLFDIRPHESPKRLVVRPGSIERASEQLKERFFFHERLLCYEASGSDKVDFLFDIRDAYDMSTEGREHTLSITDERPYILHASAKGKSFVIISTAPIDVHSAWKEQKTPFDARRGTNHSWWVYHGAQAQVVKAARIVIAPEENKQKAIDLLSAPIWNTPPKMWKEDLVWNLARDSLEGITVTWEQTPAILAGLPWFFQVWTRDEAIALGGLLAQQRYTEVGEVLLRHTTRVLPNGNLPNRAPHSDVGSSDGAGWVFLRASQLFAQAKDALTKEQWQRIFEALAISLERLQEESNQGLVPSAWQETWMDTTGELSDGRDGPRIEIQALTLRSLQFARELAGFLDVPMQFLDWERKLLELTQQFRTGDILADGSEDNTIRPNIFLAYYAYPALFSKDEWRTIVHKALGALQVEWNGLSTIDKQHAWFHPHHTGVNDNSYHRGDVWYFVNNFAALCCADLGGDLRQAAESIFEASKKDLLWIGACGHASEIASSAVQEPFGCWCQAWSAATLLELKKKLNE